MQISFSAQIFAVIAFGDEELDLLMRCADAHYDIGINALSKQGGCLYGAKNVNTWYNESTDPDKKESDKGRPYSFRDIDEMVSALGMSRYLSDDKNVGNELRNTLSRTLHNINEKTKLVNNSFANL